MKKKVAYFLYFIFFLLASEIFLRLYYGFCDTVLMQNDPNYEYIAQPNQDRFRFRHHIHYNSVSMRSEEPDTTATVILGFGDSVINGGVQTDQDSLATTLLSDSLTKRQGHKVQFLNISAGSWGPDNCFAYLKQHGRFGSRRFFLFVSSHDAFDDMTFDKIVDVNVSFPSHQAFSAIYELMDRYVLPRLAEKFASAPKRDENLVINKKTDSTPFNTGFAAFAAYTKANGIPLTMYLHAEQSELKAGRYNDQGQKIIQFAAANQIPLIEDLQNRLSADDFRDDIHINARGQREMAKTVLRYMEKADSIRGR